MTFTPASSDPDRLPGQPEPGWLDEHHVIEPLDMANPDEVAANHPIVVDATGRVWRVRYRPAWGGTLTRLAPVLLGVVLLALLLVLGV